MRTNDYTLIVAHDQRDRAEMLDCAVRHAIGMHWPVTGWTDTTTPRTERPVLFNPGLHHYTRFADGRLAPTWAYSPSFIYRQSPLYR